jgi:tetratricopeptide (TPR) repeat protein
MGNSGNASENEVAAIVERLLAGRCVLCAGSRLGERTYHDLIAKLLAQVPDVDPGDAERALASRPLAAAGFVRRRLGDRFPSELKAAWQSAGELSEAVKLLGELPFRAIVTTDYGSTFERAFSHEGATPRVYTHADSAELKKDGKARFVLKALGSLEREETLLFSAEDLQGALADGGYRSVAHDLYRSRSFLFVGFESHDPDLAILLERVLSGARAADVEHFAILPGLTAIERDELYAAHRIRVLDTDDATALARALRQAIGEHEGPVLPDDDDLEAWLQLYAEDPARADARDRLGALERRLREAGDWERLVELHLGMIDAAPAAAARAQRLLQVARLFENEVGDLAKAFTALVAGYKEDPQPHVWDELERLASATGQWAELLAELAEIVPSLPEAERAAAWVRLAKHYADKLGNGEHALSSLDEALKLEPGHTQAEELRIELLRRAERWKELAEALAARAAHELAPARKAELFIEQAELWDSRLSDGAQAARLFRSALEADPASTSALSSLEALLRRRGEWRELLQVLEEQAKLSSGEESAALLREAAEVCADKLGDRRAAVERYESLLSESPRDLAVLRSLERLYTSDGRHEDYLRTLGLQAEALESERERAALYRRMAAEWEEHPGGAERAAACLEKLLAIDARSEDAFRSLERLYRAEHKWDELIAAYRRHAAIVPAPIRAEIHAQIGGVYEQELRDPSRAIEAFLDVDAALPNHAEALQALTRLYEKTEAYEKTVEVCERRAQLAEVRSQKVDLYQRAGELCAERLGDAQKAEAIFARALELDPTHVPAMTALVEIYRKNGEFLKAARLLVEAVPHTLNRLERTRLLVEAGEIYQGLDDRKKATQLYLDALAVDPEHVEAGERVADLLWEEERFVDLVPVLEMLTRLGPSDGESTMQLERLTRLGRAAQAVGQTDKAHKAWARAAEIDPTHLEAQRGRAELALARGDHAEALKALVQVLEHHEDGLPPSERVELFASLAQCELKLEHKDDAKVWLKRALDLDPTHRPSLLAMMELGESQPESIIDAKKALLATSSPDEKVRLLGEIGDLYLEKLEDPPQAVGAYREALELRPDDHKFLHKCLDVYVEQKAWQQAVEMLERLIAVEKSPQVRAKYRHAAGLICRDELGKPGLAAKLLNEALDDDPSLARSAAALEELYRERQEWKELMRFYRRALKRIGPASPDDGQNDERLRLWSALGDVCIDQLGERESAIAAFEAALAFDPKNLDRHRQLADLYVQAGPDRFEKAIVEHQLLLRADKQRIVSYRALKHLYIQTNQRDKSAACSYALTFLKKAEPEDAKPVAELKSRAAQPLTLARRPLTDEMWARLMHPDEDKFLAALFAAVAPTLALPQAQPHKALGLQRKDALENDPRPLAKTLVKMLEYACSTLAVPAPEAYFQPDGKDAQKEPIRFLNAVDNKTLQPVFVLGGPLAPGGAVDRRPERETVFELARRAAQLRPERFIRNVLPQPAQLALILDAAMSIGGEEGEPAGAEAKKTAQGLSRSLPPSQLEQVATLGRTLRAAGLRSDEAALKWLQASDLTASRAALVLGGDLEACARALAAEPQSQAALPATQRLLDLVWSSITEEIFTVRKHLGLM